MEILNKIMEVISKPEVIAVLAFVVEMAMRFIKTEKPWSILHAAKRIIRSVAKFLGVLADLMDKVLPQVVEQPKLGE